MAAFPGQQVKDLPRREVLHEARAAAAAVEQAAAPGSDGGGSDGGGGLHGDDTAAPAEMAGALGVLDYGRTASPQPDRQATAGVAPEGAVVAGVAEPHAVGADAALSDAGLHGGNETASVRMHECPPSPGMLMRVLAVLACNAGVVRAHSHNRVAPIHTRAIFTFCLCCLGHRDSRQA